MKQTMYVKKKRRDIEPIKREEVIVIEDDEPIVPIVPIDPPTTSTTPQIIPIGEPVPFQQYLTMYTEYLRIKEDNIKLRSKLITTQEDLKQWKESKTNKKTKLQGEELKNAVIDIIMNSDLNIESIPDELERELYSLIINQITTSTSLIKRFIFCS